MINKTKGYEPVQAWDKSRWAAVAVTVVVVRVKERKGSMHARSSFCSDFTPFRCASDFCSINQPLAGGAPSIRVTTFLLARA